MSREFDSGMGAGHLPPGHPLHALIQAALIQRAGPASAPESEPSGYWDAEFFGLERARAFRQAAEPVRRAMLGLCAEGLLEEGYFIEKSGLNCNATLMLAGETTEQKSLYALMAADEAVHLRLLAPYLPRAAQRKARNPFLRLLARIIEDGRAPAKVYLLQVLLEGWGLAHYKDLADGCREPGLTRSLRRILKDEALHHRGGVLLFDPAALSGADRVFAAEAVVEIFRMVQAGPQLVAGAVETACGGLSRRQKVELFADLDAQAQSAARIGLLRKILSEVDSSFLEGVLERYDLERPYTPQECAA